MHPRLRWVKSNNCTEFHLKRMIIQNNQLQDKFMFVFENTWSSMIFFLLPSNCNQSFRHSPKKKKKKFSPHSLCQTHQLQQSLHSPARQHMQNRIIPNLVQTLNNMKWMHCDCHAPPHPRLLPNETHFDFKHQFIMIAYLSNNVGGR